MFGRILTASCVCSQQGLQSPGGNGSRGMGLEALPARRPQRQGKTLTRKDAAFHLQQYPLQIGDDMFRAGQYIWGDSPATA